MLNWIDEDYLREIIKTRSGEAKLGQVLHCFQDSHWSAKAPGFVILGIEEDIGVRGNLGRPGTAAAFRNFMAAFSNLQANRFLPLEQIYLGGRLVFPALMQKAARLNPELDDERKEIFALCSQIDEEVTETISDIVSAGHVRIGIGGGHNNAYGNIKGCSQALNKSLAVLNIDPHADFRTREGRHSGNGFSYAFADGFLKRYAVFALQSDYNHEAMLEKLEEDPKLQFISMRELIRTEPGQQEKLLKDLLNWFEDAPFGLELDLDVLTGFPVSALNAGGLSISELRRFLMLSTELKAPRYLHLAEASPGQANSDQEKQLIGKTLSVLVSDFLKSYPLGPR